MREGHKQTKLGRTTSHKKALLANLATELFRYERIRTTEAKAKELRRFAEPLITRARRGGLAEIRFVSRYIRDRDVLKKLFDDIAPRYVNRPGGYLRLYKLGYRAGDNTRMNLVELVDAAISADKKSGKHSKEERKAKTQ